MKNIALQIARIKAGFDTQGGLAEAAGCSASMIGQLEKGVKRPSVNLAREIARAVGEPIEALFFANCEDAKSAR